MTVGNSSENRLEVERLRALRPRDPELAGGRRRQQGFALAAMVPLILVGLMAWSAAYRSFGPILQIEERAAKFATDQPLAGSALSRGILLLSRSRPPENPYFCRQTVVHEGVAFDVRLRFTALGDQSWLIELSRSTGSEPACGFEFPEN